MAKGYTVDWVSSHSLLAGGAMAMKLSGATDSTIMRIGCWTSLTYLTYTRLGHSWQGWCGKCPNNSHFRMLGN
jgi:hypothetical protein